MTKKSFYTALMACVPDADQVGYSTVTTTMNGRPPTGDSLSKLMRAIAVYRDANHIQPDRLQLDYQATLPQLSTGRFDRHKRWLNGVWILVMYRAKRRAAGDAIPPDDFRIGILIYGLDNSAGQRTFQIVGHTTLWSGYIKRMNDHYLFYAEEVSDVGIQEAVVMLMHDTFDGAISNTLDHHGLALGIARGENDTTDFPIYASRALLWRIPASDPAQSTVPLNDAQVRYWRSACGYFSKEEYESWNDDNSASFLVKERKEAIKRFIERENLTQNKSDNRRFIIRS